MNRRSFTLCGLSLALLPSLAAAQSQATPELEHDPELSPVDPRTRDITALLSTISPATLLEALETAPISNEMLITASEGEMPNAVPWADYGDTDLHHSLGGVIITTGSDLDIYGPEMVMLGGYIVYETAEIAYHEFARKLSDVDEDSLVTSAIGGTNVWLQTTDEFQIGILRIGNVIILALTGMWEHTAIEGLIDHLGDVAASITN